MPRKQYLGEGELGVLRLLDPTLYLDGVVFGLQALDRELDHLVLGGIMYFGEVAHALHFSELMLNVAAFNELHHRRFTARNGNKNEGGGGGGIWCRNSPFAYVASCGGNGDCTFLVKVSCVLLLCMCVRSCEVTDNSAALRCPRPLKLVFRFSPVFVCAG